MEILAGEDRLVGDGRDRAVDADFRRLAFGEVEVGAFVGDQIAEKFVDAGHG